MFAPLGQYLGDNIPQLHQGMGIENIIWLYAYAFGLVTLIGAALLIMVARRLIQIPEDESEEGKTADEVKTEAADVAGEEAPPPPPADS